MILVLLLGLSITVTCDSVNILNNLLNILNNLPTQPSSLD